MEELRIQTEGEGFYSITDRVEEEFHQLIETEELSGVLFLFVQHTSCALAISEDYDPSAKGDLEKFFQHLAPSDLSFIQHTLEGSDDSPSHMKSALLHQHLALPVDEGKILLGRWQGIFLAEFRDAPHTRKIVLKFLPEKSS